MPFNGVIFLDRDGVINRDSPDYVKNWNEFRFLPGSLEALNLLTQKRCRLIIVTNQSVVNRGMVPLDVLTDTHDHLRRAVERTGGRIEDIFFCPHRPDENCTCRKPKPGMILQARDRYGIDLADSIMVGDSAKDIECGINAGCGATLLVRTGNGSDALKALAARGIQPAAQAANLLEAAHMILAGHVIPAI
jgi:D-glycero-D-manno-heptose 1,7-bisphosphate phosphatase